MLNVITVSTLFNMEADSFILERKKTARGVLGKDCVSCMSLQVSVCWGQSQTVSNPHSPFAYDYVNADETR